MSEQEKLALVGGLLMGEGCPTVEKRKYKNNEYFYPSIRIGMKDKELLEEVYDILGGSLYETKNNMYIWMVYGSEEVSVAIERLMPYLRSFKKEQCEVLQEFVQAESNKEALYWKMRFLKQKANK